MSPSRPNLLLRVLVGLLTPLVWLSGMASLAWSFGAITLTFPIPPLRWPVGMGLFAIALVVVYRLRRHPFAPGLALTGIAVPVFLWWLTLSPRQDRSWQADMAKISWAEIEEDEVTILNFRNANRPSADVCEPRWETRTYRLSRLQHLDLYLAYWGSPHLCHTMMTFDFGEDGRVCVSIEARREEDESYSPPAGAFRQYELYYVFGDERDVVRLRADLRSGSDQVYLFRLQTTPETVRAIFLDYAASSRSLREKPAWYHSLSANCSTLIRRHVRSAYDDGPWDWRIIANGHIDERLYEQGHLDRSLPFDELKKRSFINPAAVAAGDAVDFSEQIRAGRPGF